MVAILAAHLVKYNGVPVCVAFFRWQIILPCPPSELELVDNVQFFDCLNLHLATSPMWIRPPYPFHRIELSIGTGLSRKPISDRLVEKNEGFRYE